MYGTNCANEVLNRIESNVIDQIEQSLIFLNIWLRKTYFYIQNKMYSIYSIDCPEHDFQCPSGRCIPTEYLCDSFDDCLDGADEDQDCCKSYFHGPLARYVKLRVAHAPGMPGTFSPPPRVSDPGMHHGTCVTHVSWCMPRSPTSYFLWSRWRGKRSRQSQRMRNPPFYASGKRPMT